MKLLINTTLTEPSHMLVHEKLVTIDKITELTLAKAIIEKELKKQYCALAQGDEKCNRYLSGKNEERICEELVS
jgi:hypothetical protein